MSPGLNTVEGLTAEVALVLSSFVNTFSLSSRENINYFKATMDLFPNEQNFDLDKCRQTFHNSLKEHHKISNIPKFRCEML